MSDLALRQAQDKVGGDFGRRSSYDVTGIIYPESHSSLILDDGGGEMLVGVKRE